jgi:peroxiredoxin Q/BCP
MRLISPSPAPTLELSDIHGQPIAIGRTGRRTLLCFFRDPACPFCNYRIYELTNRHRALADAGLDIVAVFNATAGEVQRFVARHPRPFRIAADPTAQAYALYGIESSPWRKLKGILTRVPTVLKGLRIVGLAGLRTSNLMPADFLIDADGRIVKSHYGSDAGDRMAFEEIERFAEAGGRGAREAAAA